MASDSVRMAGGGGIRLVGFPDAYDLDDWEQKGPVSVETYRGATASPTQLKRSEGRPQVSGAVYDNEGRLIRQSERQTHRGRASINPHKLGAPPPPGSVLRGNYVYAGLAIRPFGHVLIEFLSRLWWIENIDDLAGMRLLVQPYLGLNSPTVALPRYLKGLITWVNPDANARFLQTPWLGGFLELLGLSPRQITFVPAKGARIESLTVASPVISINGAAHAAFPRIYNRIADRVCGDSRPDGRRVYLSRAKLKSNKRMAVNEARLEALLSEHGFSVVYPERLPLADQIRLMRNADVVAGCGGSAMHMLCFARPGTRALVLDVRAANNQFAIEQVHGIRATHLWMGGRSPYRAKATWQIDLDMVRRQLPAIL